MDNDSGVSWGNSKEIVMIMSDGTIGGCRKILEHDFHLETHSFTR